MDLQIPDFVERKGSLFLRSDHMEYGRDTLVSNWYQAREAEPMDNCLWNKDKKEKAVLHRSTYNRLGNSTEPFPRLSTSHDQMSGAIQVKEDFQPRITRNPMLNEKNIGGGSFERDTGCSTGKYGEVLPRHPPDHNKRYLDTTHRVDYKPPFPYEPQMPTTAAVSDSAPNTLTSAWRKCPSQFTDVGDYRRHGNNTWQDESGCYATQRERATLVPKTDTIPQRLL